MEDRRAIIRELEDKNKADTQAVNKLYEDLGEALFQRIGEGEPFADGEGDSPGGILAEFRKLHSEIAESRDIIKSLEGDIQRLKELEAEISEKETEQTRLENEFDEVNVQLGKFLMETADSSDSLKLQEEVVLAKIDEQEKKLAELESKEGGIFAWIGKNAQMAVSKGLLLKNRFALQRLYRSAGEKYVSGSDEYHLEGEANDTAEKAKELKEQLSQLAVNLAMLKGERRNMGDLFSSEGSPARRIQSQEKHIAHTQSQFPEVHRRFGTAAAASKTESEGSFGSILISSDDELIEKSNTLNLEIAERKLKISVINASISIDYEKSEIEKSRKSIQNQRQKITAAEEAIENLEEEIGQAEKRIEELDIFIQKNGSDR